MAAFNRVSGAFREVVRFIAPPRCRGCGAPLLNHHNALLCRACVETLEWIGPGACRRCGWPTGPHASIGPNGCSRCGSRAWPLTAVAAVCRYRGGIRAVIRNFKFSGERQLAPQLAGLMAARLRRTDFPRAIDAVIPVPLHSERLRQRGFNQASLLADGIGGELGIPVLFDRLGRIRHTPPQALLHRNLRLDNMRNAFSAPPEALAGKGVLLVDDVLTTGATLIAAAAACREAGARRVYAVTLAR